MTGLSSRAPCLFVAWLEDPFRTMRDLDLRSFGEPEAQRLVRVFREIIDQAVQDDGTSVGSDRMVAEPIRGDQLYGGFRVISSAYLGTAIIPIQIDIGFDDVVTPGPSEVQYPVLLDHPAPKLKAYPSETVVAEKFEAMVALDLANSRMKDFYDLLAMSRLFTFRGAVLAAAIRATFEMRKTPIPLEPPPSLTRAFWDDPQKAIQWRSFLAREPLLIDDPHLPTAIREIGKFIMPATYGVTDGGQVPGHWSPGSGWRSAPVRSNPNHS